MKICRFVFCAPSRCSRKATSASTLAHGEVGEFVPCPNFTPHVAVPPCNSTSICQGHPAPVLSELPTHPHDQTTTRAICSRQFRAAVCTDTSHSRAGPQPDGACALRLKRSALSIIADRSHQYGVGVNPTSPAQVRVRRRSSASVHTIGQFFRARRGHRSRRLRLASARRRPREKDHVSIPESRSHFTLRSLVPSR